MEILPGPSSVQILAMSGAPITITGTTAETAFATIAVPAGSMGPNGSVRITFVGSCAPSSANLKTFRVRFGGLAGTAYGALTLTTALALRDQRQIQNRNSTASQIGMNSSAPAGGWGQANAAIVTSVVDTSQAVDIVLTGTLSSAAETMVLESYVVELIRPL